MATRHGDVGDVCAPDLIGAFDLELAQQVGVFVVALVGDAGAGPTVNGFEPHFPAQTLNSLAVGLDVVVPFQNFHQLAAAQAGVDQVGFVENALDVVIFFGFFHGLVTQA